MRIVLLVVENTKQGFISEGINEYITRLKHYVKFEQKVVKLPKNFKKASVQEQKKKEEELLLKELENKKNVVLLDEIGKEFTSVQFADWLQKRMNSTGEIIFVIGGAYGFSDNLRQKYTKIALSKMTFSHQMVRLFFVEQLYRAFTILQGENYHH